jgi:hypothetical protein
MARNKYSRELMETERTFYSKKYMMANGSSKQTWKVTNEVLGKQRIGRGPIVALMSKNNRLSAPAHIANCFNEYFVNIGLANSSQANSSVISDKAVFSSFDFSCPSAYTIFKTISELKEDKPAGPDNIPVLIYKQQAKLLVPVIQWMFSQVIISGQFPAHWGVCHITPVYKEKGSKEDMSNYRPISIISVISKLFEKTIAPQLVKYLEDKRLLNDNQYGFRAQRSTQFAILHVTELIREMMNREPASRPYVSAVMLDLSKAFDCVNHQLILNQLQELGFTHSALILIHTYLLRRSQQVKISSVENRNSCVLSHMLQTRCGVPQGSILGPILFNIYVNSLSNVIRDDPGCTVVSYADDTTIITSANSPESLVARTTEHIMAIKSHLSQLGLSLNLQKTQYIIFGKLRSGSADMCIRIPSATGIDEIKPATSAKLLGVTISQDLSFTEYQKHVLSKMRSGLFVIKTVRQKISKQTAMNLLHALLYSHHDYCSLVWSGRGSALIARQMESTHKMALRHILNKPYDFPSSEVYRLANAIPLFLRREYNLLRFVYAATHDLVPINWRNFLQPSRGNRQSQRLYFDYNHSRLFHDSLHQRASKLWNALPGELRNCVSALEFKKRCLEHMHKVHNSEWAC